MSAQTLPTVDQLGEIMQDLQRCMDHAIAKPARYRHKCTWCGQWSLNNYGTTPSIKHATDCPYPVLQKLLYGDTAVTEAAPPQRVVWPVGASRRDVGVTARNAESILLRPVPQPQVVSAGPSQMELLTEARTIAEETDGIKTENAWYRLPTAERHKYILLAYEKLAGRDTAPVTLKEAIEFVESVDAADKANKDDAINGFKTETFKLFESALEIAKQRYGIHTSDDWDGRLTNGQRSNCIELARRQRDAN